MRLIGLPEGDLALGTIAYLDDPHRVEHADHDSVVETCDCRVGGGFNHIPAGDLAIQPTNSRLRLVAGYAPIVACMFLNIPKRSLNLKKTCSPFSAPAG